MRLAFLWRRDIVSLIVKALAGLLWDAQCASALTLQQQAALTPPCWISGRSRCWPAGGQCYAEQQRLRCGMREVDRGTS